MLIQIFSDTEYYYNLEVFCPKCGSSDVIVEISDGYFHFSNCNKCGFKLNKINK